MKLRVHAVLCLLCVLLSAKTVVAKGEDPKRAEARSKFETGSRAYNLRNYEEALADFKAAYVLIGDPSLLFNIAQCERQMRHFEDAKKSFMSYLREAQPPASQAEEVERILAAIDQALEEERGKVRVETPPSPPAPVAPTVTVSETPTRKNPRWVWPVIGGLGAVVVVALGVGLGVGLSRGPRYLTPTNGNIDGN